MSKKIFVKKNRIKSNNLRTIKRAFPRFLSLLIMSMLGVFVFVGLTSTAPDMIKSLDTYMDGQNIYDIRVLSTMGLTDRDVEKIKKLDGAKQVVGLYTSDTIVKTDLEDTVMKIYSLSDDINQVTLLSGNMPKGDSEIVLEANALNKLNLNLGDEIILTGENLGDKKVKVVGTIDSALYFNSITVDQGRGNTSVGSGKISYYGYVNEDAFAMDCYSEIDITVKGAKEKITSYPEYVELVEDFMKELEAIQAECEEERHQEIIDETKKKTEESMVESYQEIEDELEDSYITFDFDKATDEISNLLLDVQKIDRPEWYIYDRTGYSIYVDYIDDSNSIKNLAKIFPIIFFAVAVLISLISMNRMASDDRLEIGTLKSMGFASATIFSKYVVFAFSATLIGATIGAISGLVVIPKLIFGIYTILFELPKLILTVQWSYTVLGYILTIVCVCGSSMLTVSYMLREKPSELMRPKAPKNGSRILLENLDFIWKRIRFSRKVTIRNIFRYKKRVLVTIGGIAGCTALILTGFGVKDSIVEVPTLQYYGIYQFDGISYVSEYGTSDLDEADYLQYPEINSCTPAKRITAELDGVDGFIQVVEDDEALSHIAKFTEVGTGKKVNLEKNACILDEKLSAMTGLKKGDVISIVDVDHNRYEIKISAVVDNYIEHFAYMDAETYKSFGQSFNPNIIYFNTPNLSLDERDALSEKMLTNTNILNISYRQTLIENVDNSLQSLNKVVLILIVLAGLLAFVVLYNLANINISERKREIATLKVLGFYDREVDSYITRETAILTIIGITLGLCLGIFVSHAVVATVEIEKCRFVNELKPLSYIYAAGMSAVFTIIVNVITHFNLKKIDMTGSLKSVE